MSFVLDNSVTRRWFLGDGKPQELAYAGRVLDLMKEDGALVGVRGGQRYRQGGVVWPCNGGEVRAFLEILEGVDIDVDEAAFSPSLSDTLQAGAATQTVL